MMISGSSMGQSSSYSISGNIFDKETNESIPFAYIHLEELNRTAVSTVDGEFEIKNIPSGTYTLTAHRIGYRTQSQKIEISSNNLELDIKLNVSVLSSEAIEVLGESEDLTGSGLEHASKKIFGSDLRRNLGSTLSETLTSLPGFDQRSNGAAPGRPVIRGLGDERVMILQDGISSGDVSAQSSDHSVTIDPVSATEIEIARGPAALAYGSNAIGGVINVVKNQVQTTLPSQLTGTLSLNGQKVNSGLSSAINISFPVKSFAVQADINGRYGLNTDTPRGEIRNTFYETTNDAIGVSWIRPWGYAGASTSIYFSNYGIPPDPNGHPDGVDIELRKFNYALKGEYLPKSNFIKTIEGDFSINNYNHKEFETTSSIGTEFGLVTTTSQININHGEAGFFSNGKFGVWGEIEDYAVRGANTPDANSYKFASYIIEEFDFSAFRVEAGLRFDYVLNKPKENNPNSDIGNIRQRDFSALSSSVNALYEFGNGFTVGTVLLHSFRAPSLEELFSEGPHLASFSFEIGNPELKPERSLAKEIFARWQSNKSALKLALFHNDFSNFNYARNTGRQNDRFPSLNDYQFEGTEALLYGFETSAEVQLSKTLVTDFSVSYTIGQQDTTDENGSNKGTRPLPQIPPFKAKASVKYSKDGFEIGTRFKYAAKQDRTGEFENPTDSYFLTDLFAQYRFNTKKLLHTLSLNVNNLLDEEYYNHLSRIKDLRPEPGRNITILYRIYF